MEEETAAETAVNPWLPVPKTLEEAIERLRSFPGWEETAKGHTEEDFLGMGHHGAGRSMRNGWHLWFTQEGTIHDWFEELGIFHGDDRSSIILSAFWHQANGLKYDVQRDVARFKEHWEKNGGMPAKPTAWDELSKG